MRRVLALLFLVGCGQTSAPSETHDPPGPMPTTAVPTPPAPAAPAEDAVSRMRAALHLASTRKYRVRATLTAPTGATTTNSSSWVAEFVPPDTRMMVMTGVGGQMQFLSSGTRVFTRHDPAAAWNEMPAGMPSLSNASIEHQFEQSIASGEVTFEPAGDEALDGRPTTKFRMTWRREGSSSPAMPGAPGFGPMSMTGFVWLGADGLVYKMEGDQAPIGSHHVLVYEYDDSIAIDVPPAR